MPTPTYIPLATVTLASADSEIVFSSIPATYRDLIVVASAKNTTETLSNDLYIQFNGDTGANYSFVQMFGLGSGSGASTSGTSQTNNRALLYSGTTQNYFANSVAQIMDYSATDKHKTVLSRRDTSAEYTVAVASRWANTNAINTIAIKPLAGALAIGSTFSLYGVN